MYSIPQRAAAEFLGTFGVVLFGAGTLCAAQALQGQNPSVALLMPLAAAIAYGAAFAGLSAAFSHISGGHFNPALTLSFWATRRMNTFDTLTYWVAQLGGAVVAAYALRLAVPEALWRAAALGTPQLAGGVTRGPGMLLEGLGAFFLTLVFFGLRISDRDPTGAMASAAGGLVLIAGSLLNLPLTGGAMNPARAFGPALAASYWTNQGVYWVGPLAGAVLAAWICEALSVRSSHPHG